MVVCLSGENGYGVDAMLHSLVHAFEAEHGDMSIERLEGEVTSFERLQESLLSLPFLSARKLVVLWTPGANKQFVERAAGLLAQVPSTTDVVIVEPKLDRRGNYYKLLRKSTDFRESNPLDEPALAKWLVSEAKAAGGSMSLADAHTLLGRVGVDQHYLRHELEKLVLYDPVITHTSIEQLTEATPQSTIFELLSAAFSGNVKQALRLYQEQRAQRVDTAQIIAMLTWQLRIIALIKTGAGRSAADIASASRLSPFVLRKSQPIAQHLPLSRVKQMVTDLLEIDVRSKREAIDVDEALQNYLLQLAW